jgi:hypothetical protein
MITAMTGMWAEGIKQAFGVNRTGEAHIDKGRLVTCVVLMYAGIIYGR